MRDTILFDLRMFNKKVLLHIQAKTGFTFKFTI